MELADVSKTIGAIIGTAAAAIGGYLGVNNYLDKKKKEREEFFDSLATKEQVERHKKETDERLDRQDHTLELMNQNLIDMPLKLIAAMKDHE